MMTVTDTATFSEYIFAIRDIHSNPPTAEGTRRYFNARDALSKVADMTGRVDRVVKMLGMKTTGVDGHPIGMKGYPFGLLGCPTFAGIHKQMMQKIVADLTIPIASEIPTTEMISVATFVSMLPCLMGNNRIDHIEFWAKRCYRDAEPHISDEVIKSICKHAESARIIAAITSCYPVDRQGHSIISDDLRIRFAIAMGDWSTFEKLHARYTSDTRTSIVVFATSCKATTMTLMIAMHMEADNRINAAITAMNNIMSVDPVCIFHILPGIRLDKLADLRAQSFITAVLRTGNPTIIDKYITPRDTCIPAIILRITGVTTPLSTIMYRGILHVYLKGYAIGNQGFEDIIKYGTHAEIKSIIGPDAKTVPTRQDGKGFYAYNVEPLVNAGLIPTSVAMKQNKIYGVDLYRLQADWRDYMRPIRITRRLADVKIITTDE